MTSTSPRPKPIPQEPILAECPRCRLPIYASDARRLLSLPNSISVDLHHAGCAAAAEGEYWERQVQSDLARLRACGYAVEVTITRPVR